MKILLVEDDVPTQMVYQFYLNKLCYPMELVARGVQAVQCIQSKPNGYYSAMILDLGLPDIGGETVVKSIREYEQERGYNPLPIIITTAHSDEKTLEECRALGANYAFTKPVKLNTFQQILADLVHVA
jgi:CheY-like chemotaxis protein